jgi:hypothetical protein
MVPLRVTAQPVSLLMELHAVLAVLYDKYTPIQATLTLLALRRQRLLIAVPLLAIALLVFFRWATPTAVP